MKETSAFDLLVDYPRKHGLEFDTHDDYRRFFMFPSDSFIDTKFVIFKSGSFYFYAHDSYTAKLTNLKTFTGLYTVAASNLPELMVHRKDLANRLMRTHKRKTGISHMDENLVITSDTKELLFMLSPRAVSQFLELAEKFSPLHLVIQDNYINNIIGLKDKKVIGLETGQWLYKEEDVELFLKLGKEIIESAGL